MTKKHFNYAVEIIKDLKQNDRPETELDLVQDSFTTLFRKFNDRFDPSRFNEACSKVRK